METIQKHLSQVGEGMSLLDQEQIAMAVLSLRIVRKNMGTVYVMGNGGSHATASHFANDLIKMGKVRAVCLGDAVSVMTAYGNDDGWDNMYSNPLRKHLKPGDGVVGISCSGNSENVVRALRQVSEIETVLSIGLTGLSRASEICKIGLGVLVHAPVPDMRVQEDLHLMICHAIARSLQEGEE